MTYEIKSIPLIEICEKVVDCPHSTPKWTNEGVFVLRNSNIKNGRLDLSNPSFTDELHYEDRSRRAKLQAGDLVITREAPMGEVCQIPDNLKCCLGQRMVLLRPSKEKCDGKYLLYALQSRKVQHEINSYDGTGSTVSNLRIPVLKNLSIPKPSLTIQKNIAHTLGTLDTKIELNKKTNEILEEIAKGLFKSWFIDFDPIKAKSEGRSTGLTDEISDLFPDSFEESELGNIPENWSYKNIGDVFETILGGTPSRKNSEYWEGNIPWIGSGMVNEFRVTKETEFITELGLVKSSTKLLPKRSTLIAITGATLGQISINEIEVCTNQSVVAIKPCKKTSPEFVFLWVQKNVNYLINSQTGGAQQHINKNNVNEMKILLPNREIMEIFGNIVKPIFDKISINLFESETLSNLRDQMLPKLISGEIRISDAEKMINEVGI